MTMIPRGRSARRELAWTLGGFALFFAAFLLILELRFPHWTDREYAARREKALACPTDRPILAVIGGSRVGTGFAPETLPPVHAPDGGHVTVLNYSHLGAGPRMNLLQLHRLLRDGITPKWIVMEIVPAHLTSEIVPFAELSFADVRILQPFWSDRRLLVNPLKLRGKAMYRYRNGLLDELAPAFATGAKPRLGELGGNPRWLESSPRATEDKPDLIREIRWQYQERMQTWSVDPELDAALREFLCVCRSKGIRVALTLFPESSEFRSWYGEDVEERIQAYVRSLGLPCFDCRTWMSDEDFHDPHHLTPEGAMRLSQMLGERVIPRMIAEGWR